MTNLEPRPFHVGTKVRRPDGPAMHKRMRVVFAGGSYLWLEVLYESRLLTEPKEFYVHLDGAPLGEWVPVSRDTMSSILNHAYEAPHCAHDALNAILRGEVEDD